VPLLTFAIRGGYDAGTVYDLAPVQAAGESGGCEVLACHPASTTHRQMSRRSSASQVLGLNLRLSVGIEHIDDIIADLDQALAAATALTARSRVSEACHRRPALFPARELRERLDDLLTRELAGAGAGGARVRHAYLDMARFRHELAGLISTRPVPSATARMDDRAARARRHSRDAPALLRSVQSGRELPSQCADRIAAPSSTVASSGSSRRGRDRSTVIRAMHSAPACADASGHFTRAARSDYTALVCALTRSEARFGEEGRGIAVRSPCTPRAIVIRLVQDRAPAGIGRAALRSLHRGQAAWTRARSRRASLRIAAGLIPVLISATAGTTVRHG